MCVCKVCQVSQPLTEKHSHHQKNKGFCSPLKQMNVPHDFCQMIRTTKSRGISFALFVFKELYFTDRVSGYIPRGEKIDACGTGLFGISINLQLFFKLLKA